MSIKVDVLQYGTGSHPTTSEAANAFNTDFVSQGVVGAITNTSGVSPATGAFAVNAQGSPDTTVAVTAGVAYVTGTPTSQGSQTLRVKMDANQNVTIAANATGGTRYDWIYVKLDPTNMANPNAAGDNVATLVTSRSTSATTDNGSAPTYGYNIAVVTVANGFSTITNGNIADKRAVVALANTPLSVFNPYKFRVSRNSAANSSNGGAAALIAFDTEQYDTGNNHSGGTFTAPVAGFYQFNFAVGFQSSSNDCFATINKNGTEYSRGSRAKLSSSLVGSAGSDLIQLAANDTVDVRAYSASTVALDVGASTVFFSGYLVSKT